MQPTKIRWRPNLIPKHRQKIKPIPATIKVEYKAGRETAQMEDQTKAKTLSLQNLLDNETISRITMSIKEQLETSMEEMIKEKSNKTESELATLKEELKAYQETTETYQHKIESQQTLFQDQQNEIKEQNTKITSLADTIQKLTTNCKEEFDRQ